MNKLKLNLPIILVMFAVLSIAGFASVVQLQNIKTKINVTDNGGSVSTPDINNLQSETNQLLPGSNVQAKDNFDDNINLLRFFRRINV